jgi:hypothetical protein
MMYAFRAGDIYAVTKSTGELIWDEDVSQLMGPMMIENLTSIDSYMANTPDVVATIDMPITLWLQELDFRCLGEFTTQEEDYYRYLANMGKRVFGESLIDESSAFLRMRLYVEKVPEKVYEARKKGINLQLIKN